jgi:hypothetical protein
LWPMPSVTFLFQLTKMRMKSVIDDSTAMFPKKPRALCRIRTRLFCSWGGCDVHCVTPPGPLILFIFPRNIRRASEGPCSTASSWRRLALALVCMYILAAVEHECVQHCCKYHAFECKRPWSDDWINFFIIFGVKKTRALILDSCNQGDPIGRLFT